MGKLHLVKTSPRLNFDHLLQFLIATEKRSSLWRSWPWFHSPTSANEVARILAKAHSPQTWSWRVDQHWTNSTRQPTVTRNKENLEIQAYHRVTPKAHAHLVLWHENPQLNKPRSIQGSGPGWWNHLVRRAYFLGVGCFGGKGSQAQSLVIRIDCQTCKTYSEMTRFPKSYSGRSECRGVLDSPRAARQGHVRKVPLRSGRPQRKGLQQSAWGIGKCHPAPNLMIEVMASGKTCQMRLYVQRPESLPRKSDCRLVPSRAVLVIPCNVHRGLIIFPARPTVWPAERETTDFWRETSFSNLQGLNSWVQSILNEMLCKSGPQK